MNGGIEFVILTTMPNKTELFLESHSKTNLSDVQPGDTVRVHQKFTEGGKEKTQVFEGLVLARKHGKGVSATITVRKVIGGIGVEKIFPIHSPNISKIEIKKRSSVRRAKLYYLRTAKGKKARLKKKEFFEAIGETETPKEAIQETATPSMEVPQN